MSETKESLFHLLRCAFCFGFLFAKFLERSSFDTSLMEFILAKNSTKVMNIKFGYGMASLFEHKSYQTKLSLANKIPRIHVLHL